MIENIPATLKQYPNWVVWRYEIRDGEPTKIPYTPGTEIKARADDPKTWTSFERAVEAADPLNGSEYEGVGFELGGTSIAGIDFDSAINPKGVIDPYVLAILKLLGNPYTEISPSGKGLHAFVECGALPEGGRKLSHDHVGIEIYHGREGGRYFTATGNRALGDGIPKIDDISLPYLLITQNKDKKFRALWLGDTSAYDGDDSSADFALLVRLAALTQNDPIKMEKYFGASGLGQRDKWTRRNDYRQGSINNAIDRLIKGAIETNRTGKYTLPVDLEFHTEAFPDPDGDYVVAPAAGQGDGWFPLGDVSLIGGASGTGKTTFIFELLHKQKQKFPVLGHATFGYNFHVLAYDRGKNAFTRTMRRLRLNDSDIPTTPLPLAFGTNAVQNIINQIEKLNPIPNVIFVEGLDMLIDDANKKSIVSPFMRGLQDVAAHFHIALICSLGAPKTKRGEDYAAKRDHLSGSEAWGRNCETVAILEFSEEDDGTAPQRELTVLPRNAVAEKFSLQFESGRLVPIQPQADAERALGGRPNETLRSAINFLCRELQDGPKPGKTLIREAHELENISRTVLYRAAKELHVKIGGKIAGQAVWELNPMNAVSTNFKDGDSDDPRNPDEVLG